MWLQVIFQSSAVAIDEWGTRTMKLLQQSQSASTLRDAVRLLTLVELSVNRAEVADVLYWLFLWF